MSRYLFLMWLCLRLPTGHSNGELVLRGIITPFFLFLVPIQRIVIKVPPPIKTRAKKCAVAISIFIRPDCSYFTPPSPVGCFLVNNSLLPPFFPPYPAIHKKYWALSFQALLRLAMLISFFSAQGHVIFLLS